MTDSHQSKPLPARPGASKPTPARELNGETRVPPTEADVSEVHIEVGGTSWAVRVLGRSGSASGASPPLLLLGFWDDGDASGAPSLEAMVVGRTLETLSVEALEEALSVAAKPPDPARKKAFFSDAGQSRRR